MSLEALSASQWEAFCQLQNWKKKSTAISLGVRDGSTIHLGPRTHTSRKAWGGSTVPRGEAGAPSWEVSEVQWYCCHCGEHSVWEEVRQGARCWPIGLLGGHPGECPMGSAGTYPAKPFSTQAVLTECGIPFGVGHGLHSLRVTNHLGQAKEVVRVPVCERDSGVECWLCLPGLDSLSVPNLV